MPAIARAQLLQHTVASFQPSDYIQIGIGIATLFAVLAGIAAIGHNYNVSRINASISVAMHCSGRYDDLMKMLSDVSKTESKYFADLYYSRYWSLKSDQFDYWVNGYLDDDTFCEWSFSAIKSFANKSSKAHPPGRTVKQAWKIYLEDGNDGGVAKPHFVQFMTELEKISHNYSNNNARNSYDELIALLKKMYGTRRRPGFVREIRRQFTKGLSFEQFLRFKGYRR